MEACEACWREKRLRSEKHALKYAVELRHDKCVEALTKKVAALDLSLGLHKVVQNGQQEYLKLFIEAGADVNCPDADTQTPLLFASYYGHLRCAELLIEAGADVNMQNRSGNTALNCAAAGTAFYGERYNHNEIVKLLIKTGADVNIAAKGHHTALVFTASRGCDETVKLLIVAGADVNDDNDAITALCSAARKGQVSCLNILIKAGADVNQASSGSVSHTPLYFSASEKKNESIKLLLRSNAKINMRNNCLTASLSQKGGDVHEELTMLLFAAGEKLEEHIPQVRAKMKELLPLDDLKFNLKHMCREAIRKHLMNLDPNSHLFGRIPQLGLPSLLTKYLLYGVCLE